MANRPEPGFPIVIAEWPRNSRELVRVALDRFNNRFTIDVRSWWKDGEGVRGAARLVGASGGGP